MNVLYLWLCFALNLNNLKQIHNGTFCNRNISDIWYFTNDIGILVYLTSYRFFLNLLTSTYSNGDHSEDLATRICTINIKFIIILKNTIFLCYYNRYVIHFMMDALSGL